MKGNHQKDFFSNHKYEYQTGKYTQKADWDVDYHAHSGVFSELYMRVPLHQINSLFLLNRRI